MGSSTEYEADKETSDEEAAGIEDPAHRGPPGWGRVNKGTDASFAAHDRRGVFSVYSPWPCSDTNLPLKYDSPCGLICAILRCRP